MNQVAIEDDWPGFKEELGRKTVEVLDRWTQAYQIGKISKREYYILVHGLYNTTSGMVPEDIMSLLSNITADLRSKDG